MGKTKLNIPMFAALVVFLLTMITTHITTGLYARYTTSTSGSDSARVAKFDVDCMVVRVENTDEYTLTVINGSEVAVNYSIVVEMDSHLSVTIDNVTKKIENDETSVTFENDNWILAPGTQTDPLTLTFAVTDWSGLTDPATNYGNEETVNLGFTVKIIAVQID